MVLVSIVVGGLGTTSAVGLIAPSFYIMQHFTSAAYQKTPASEVHIAVYKITVCFKTPNISVDSLQVPQMKAKNICV
jgi:hypothetical protein